MLKSFTLIEILIVIAIIGILSAISYPLYTRHLAKVHRNQAKVILLEMANRLEEQHSINGTYKLTETGVILPITADKLPYQFTLSKSTQHSFLLNAIPNTHQPSFYKQCRILTLDQNGQHCWP
ncbi:MAG: pilus assembly protein PilE [Coxiella sp. (in: Bacteria)]|nr:MAG: pilus assembly protein PilE [Coxiella sp. (in: g-proteobacteria)]